MKLLFPTCRLALLVSSLVLLSLTARAATPAASPSVGSEPNEQVRASQGHTVHTITISYDAEASPQWSYSISPANDAKKARVKRHDTIIWKCDVGSWKVFFKGPTPLSNQAGGTLTEVSAAAGASAGGDVDGKVKKGDEFEYGVSVLLPGATEPVVDDPRIVIQ